MKTRKKNTTEPKQTLLLVCATEAEALYFSQMRKDCRYVNLTVMQAPEGRNDDIKDLVDFTGRQRSRGRFDSAWALFGFDDVKTILLSSSGSFSISALPVRSSAI